MKFLETNGARAALLLLSAVMAAQGENLYVTPSGAGSRNGASWANAFAGTGGIVWGGDAGQVGAGDTLWVAGGTYGGFSISASGASDASRLVIRRARSSNPECASATGWNPSFDSQVIINVSSNFGARGISIEPPRDFITIDGQVEDGIKFLSSSLSGGYTHAIYSRGHSNNFTYLRFQGKQVYGNHRAFAIDSTGHGKKLGGKISHCKISGLNSGIFIVSQDNFLVEHCQIWDNKYSSPEFHANLMYIVNCSHGTLRYNRFSDWVDQGVGFWGPGTQDDWHIYGNIWHEAHSYAVAPSPALVFGPYDNSWGPNWFIYNNTFAFVHHSVRGNGGQGGQVQGGQMMNNLFYLAPVTDFSRFNHDYNWYSGASAYAEAHGIAGGGQSPFVDLASGDYRIVDSTSSRMPRNKANTLGQEFARDLDGNQRGTDGVWDIGAFENVSGRPAPPIGLRVISSASN